MEKRDPRDSNRDPCDVNHMYQIAFTALSLLMLQALGAWREVDRGSFLLGKAEKVSCETYLGFCK